MEQYTQRRVRRCVAPVLLCLVTTLLFAGARGQERRQTTPRVPRLQNTRRLQTPEQARAQRPRIARAEALRLWAERTRGQNPVLPVVMQVLGRSARGVPDSQKGDLDRAWDSLLRRHPRASRDLLRQFAADWQRLPSQTRQRVVPPELMDLRSSQALTRSWCATVLRPQFARIVRTGGRVPRITPVAGGARMTSGKLIASVMQIAGGPRGWRRLRPQAFDMNRIRQAAEHATDPVIDRTDPFTGLGGGYLPGASLTLVGERFSPDKSKDKVILAGSMGGGSVGDLATLSPAMASSDGQRLSITLPGNLTPNYYWARVQTSGSSGTRTSNSFPIRIGKPMPPRPVITSISPNPQYPGRTIFIEGQNFLVGSMPLVFVLYTPLDEQIVAADFQLKSAPATRCVLGFGEAVNDHQVRADVPYATMTGGRYRVAVMRLTEFDGEKYGMSEWAEWQAKPFRYRVSFDKLTCDATFENWALWQHLHPGDPLYSPTGTNDRFLGWSQHDNLYTAWVTLHDNQADSRCTDRFAMEPGNVHPYGGFGITYGVNGDPGDIRYMLGAAAQLVSIDPNTDIQATMDTLGAIGDLATFISTVSGQPEIAAIAAIVMPILESIAQWLDSTRDPISLGTRQLQWGALDLQKLTQGTARTIQGELDFQCPVWQLPLGGYNNPPIPTGNTAHYRMSYQIDRCD